MEPEAVLSRFDSFWFYVEILGQRSKTSSSSSTPEPKPVCQIPENSSEPKVSRQLTIHTRSKSDQLLYPNVSSDADSSAPEPVLNTELHLQTVVSGREFSLVIPKAPQFKKPGNGVHKKKKALSKSLSELEFEELKGFMDLGFVFSEEDKDSSLAQIIPGVQRLGQKRDGGECRQEQRSAEELPAPTVRRPYLSEAWEVENEQKEESPLLKWRVPAVDNEIVIKDSLRWWAHTVASAVR